MKRSVALKYFMMENVVQPVAVRALAGIEQLRTGASYNPLDKRYLVDPYSLYRRLRERDPVHRSRLINGWVLTRYSDVLEALRDPRFLADDNKLDFAQKQRRQMVKDGIIGEDEGTGIAMLRNDPPDHTRLRNLVNKAFTPRTIDSLRPRVEEIVTELLDEVATDGGMDVVATLAYPLPVIVIAELLGVAPEERDQFKRWSDDSVQSFGVPSVAAMTRSLAAFRELRTYFERAAEERRREPREDLLSALVAAEQEGDKLSADEVFQVCVLLLVAGNETTTSLIGNGLYALFQHPDQFELLRDDPSLMTSAVEEMLRYDAPVQATSRFVLEDVELNGHPVKAGEQVIAVLGAANRDPEQFEEPDRLDISRVDNRHLAFGQGIHYCLGAPLARLEAPIAFRAMLERFPDLRLSDVPPTPGDNMILHGLKSLRVAF